MKTGTLVAWMLGGITLFFTCVFATPAAAYEAFRNLGYLISLSMVLVPIGILFAPKEENPEPGLLTFMRNEVQHGRIQELKAIREKLEKIMKQIEHTESPLRNPHATIVFPSSASVFAPLILNVNEKDLITNIVEEMGSIDLPNEINDYIKTFGMDGIILRFDTSMRIPLNVETTTAINKIMLAKQAVEKADLFIRKELNGGRWT